MNRKERIEARLKDSLAPLHLDVVDESYMHATGAGAESHYKVLVVSEAFGSSSLIERHRLVNQLVQEEFQSGLHALSQHTWTPEEWAERGGRLPKSPPCLGGSKAD